MSAPHSRWLTGLKWLLIVNVVASILHYADNIAFFAEYPEPPWINPGIIDAFWFVMTPLAPAGYLALRRGARQFGAFLLHAYAACSLLALGHYRYASICSVSPRINLLILLEAAAAAVLVVYVLRRQLRADGAA